MYIISNIHSEVEKITNDFDQWKDILESGNTAENQEFIRLTENLKTQYKQINKELKDCRKTIKHLSQNAELYPNITQSELDSRKVFLKDMQLAIDDVKKGMQSDDSKSKIDRNAKAVQLK